MIKNILGILLINALSFTCFAQTSLILPNYLDINPHHPEQNFPADVKQLFSFSLDASSNNCLKTQSYILTMFIYRNAVDNKFVAVYRPERDKEICWVSLESYSNMLKPDLKPGGWYLPRPNANTWCSVAGLRDPRLCPVLY